MDELQQKLEEKKLLNIISEERIHDILENVLNYDRNYQSALEVQREVINKLEKMNFSHEQNKMIGNVIDSINYCNAIYGEIAYKQGLQDGIRLIYELEELI